MTREQKIHRGLWHAWLCMGKPGADPGKWLLHMADRIEAGAKVHYMPRSERVFLALVREGFQG